MTQEELQAIANAGAGNVSKKVNLLENAQSLLASQGFYATLKTRGTGAKVLSAEEFFYGNAISKLEGSVAPKIGSFMQYDPVTREWTLSTNKENKSFLDFLNNLSPSSNRNTEQLGVSQTSASGIGKDAKTDSQTNAEKDFIEIEFQTLTGDISVLATENTLKVRVGDTINLQGVGKFLSGLYFVSEIKRSVSSSEGLTLTFTVYKNGFGSLKNANGANIGYEEGRYVEIPIEDNLNITSLHVGDKVRIVGDNAVYAHAHDGVKVPAWVKEKILTVDAIDDDGHTIRLMPIWSWTYTKFIQLV